MNVNKLYFEFVFVRLKTKNHSSLVIMHCTSTKISFSPETDKIEKAKIIRKDKRLQADRKRLKRNQFLEDSKRNIVANLGKNGIITEQPYWIYDEGHDVTPKVMEDSLFPSNPHHCENVKTPATLSSRLGKALISQRSSICSATPSEGRLSSVFSRMTIIQNRISESNISLDFMITQQPSFIPENIFSEELKNGIELHETESVAPSMFRLRIDPPPKKIQLKTTFTVNLTETCTFFMLEIPSTAESLESEEGKLISKSNSFYEKRLRTTKAVTQVATQTESVFSKNSKLNIPRNKRVNASTFVTSWGMYDTYEAIKKSYYISSCHSREEGQVVGLDEYSEKAKYNMKFNYHGFDFTDRFLVALMIMERLIINNFYRENQLTYNGLLVQDPLSLEVVYNYSLQHLWTFYSEIIGKRAVTSISWNKADPNLLAVGYGKFYYKDQCSGLVCIWNVKNPCQPERHYEFKHPVTFVTFNPTKMQILAVTFYNGSVLLIDVISWDLLIKANNDHYPLYYPVWQARWFPNDKGDDQVLITCGKNGKMYRYRKGKFFVSRKIMTIGKVHGKIQGVEQPKPCYAKKTLTLRSPSVEVLVPHPSDPLTYLVGTSDGCVVICSTLHRYDCLGVFQAHRGPVYNIQFNPFCKMVFLTCGMDWCIRIWVEGMFVPVVTLQSGMVPVQDAIWSPLHSTVVLSVTGKQVKIWDLRRRTFTPKSSIVTPSQSFNTKLHFTVNGFNVCIGDLEGNVHVMAMTEMPFSPMYQEEILVEALKSALTSHPDLLHQLLRLGKPFSSSPETSAFQTKMKHKLHQLVTRVETDTKIESPSFIM